MASLTITQVRSSNGSSHKQTETLKTLGLREDRADGAEDHPSVRGLIHAVEHLVEVRDG